MYSSLNSRGDCGGGEGGEEGEGEREGGEGGGGEREEGGGGRGRRQEGEGKGKQKGAEVWGEAGKGEEKRNHAAAIVMVTNYTNM